MPFPKTSLPIHETTLPSTGRTIRFRSMTVRDEKVLLIARASGEERDVMVAIKQVVANCLLEPDIDVDALPIFDVEFLFLRIRAVSADNVVSLSFRDEDDGKIRSFDVDLLQVEVHHPNPEVERDVPISDGMTLRLRWPAASVYSAEVGPDETAYETVMKSTIEAVYEGDVVHRADEATREELDAFFDSLPSSAFAAIDRFLIDMPRLNHVIEYTNDNGVERRIVLSTLTHFFTLR